MTITIDLYKVVVAGSTWTFTNADDEQVYDSGSGNEYYEPITTKRGQITQSTNTIKANLEVSIPIDYSLSQLLLNSTIDDVVSLTIFTIRTAVTYVSWKGRMANFKPSNGYVTINFESVFTSLRRPGLRPTYQRSCRHALYSSACGVNKADFVNSITLSSISGTTLTFTGANAFADDYFTGGFVEAPNGSKSYIISHIGNQMIIQRESQALTDLITTSGATAIDVYPGCDYSRRTCIDVYNNLLNYGGFDWIPTKNPLGGSSIV